MTPELEAKIRAEFEGYWKTLLDDPDASEELLLHCKFAAWHGYLAGRASVLDGMEQVGEYDGYGLSDIANESPNLNHNDKLYRLTPELQAEKEVI